MSIFINGRFTTQAMTGVQRFAAEITAALPQATLLAPPAGGRAGLMWEQRVLPGLAAGGLLLNLGNTAPLIRRGRQAVVIHDAGVFDTPESYSFAFRAWYRTLHWALARNGTRLLTVSEFSRGRLAAALRVDTARIGVVPEGGEHILRQPADMSVLAEHGLEPGRYALAVGTRAAHKNLGALAGAARWLGERGMVLALAGARDTSVFADAGTVAARALGRVSDAALRALYENALCLVFPSRYEGFGIPPLEAMWCRCPVLASRAGAVPEVCHNAALWFEPDRPESVIAALEQLGEMRAAMIAAGSQRAEIYSWPIAAQRVLELAEQTA